MDLLVPTDENEVAFTAISPPVAPNRIRSFILVPSPHDSPKSQVFSPSDHSPRVSLSSLCNVAGAPNSSQHAMPGNTHSQQESAKRRILPHSPQLPKPLIS